MGCAHEPAFCCNFFAERKRYILFHLPRSILVLLATCRYNLSFIPPICETNVASYSPKYFFLGQSAEVPLPVKVEIISAVFWESQVVPIIGSQNVTLIQDTFSDCYLASSWLHILYIYIHVYTYLSNRSHDQYTIPKTWMHILHSRKLLKLKHMIDVQFFQSGGMCTLGPIDLYTGSQNTRSCKCQALRCQRWWTQNTPGQGIFMIYFASFITPTLTTSKFYKSITKIDLQVYVTTNIWVVCIWFVSLETCPM